MRILHTEASTGWGGQEIRILTEAAGMIARGHDVELACPSDARIFIEATRRGVPVHPLPIGRKNLAGLRAMRRFLRDHQYDVVNTHSSTDSWLVALSSVGWIDAPPLVRTRHISAPVPNNTATRWLYRSASTHIVTTGTALRDQLIRDNGLAPERVTSVPTGIDPARFPPSDDGIRALRRIELSLDPRVPLIGIVATLRSWKGHRYLIDALPAIGDALPAIGDALPGIGDALPAISDAVPGIGDAVPGKSDPTRRSGPRLAIVGDGPQRTALEQQAAAANLDDRIVFAGNRDDVSPWLQAFDVFTLPSYANEGVPQALLQAMFTGLACVTTHAGAISEIAIDGETALVVPREDAAALAAALARLLADPALRQKLGAAARRLVAERHSLAGMLDRMEAIFAAASAARR